MLILGSSFTFGASSFGQAVGVSWQGFSEVPGQEMEADLLDGLAVALAALRAPSALPPCMDPSGSPQFPYPTAAALASRLVGRFALPRPRQVPA